MNTIQVEILQPGDSSSIKLIANWYQQEWKIPEDITIQKQQQIATDTKQFQVLMHVNNVPIATGGLYSHVGLLDKEPRFKIYENWLALVYTIPAMRGQGYGAELCRFIEQQSLSKGRNEIHLFTDTAEALYKRLGWEVIERLSIGDRSIVVMEKKSTSGFMKSS